MPEVAEVGGAEVVAPPARRGRPKSKTRAPMNITGMDGDHARFRDVALLMMELDRRFEGVTTAERARLAERIAEELGFFGATAGATRDPRAWFDPTIRGRVFGRRGPKPALADIHLLSQIEGVLRDAGITLAQWRNGRDSRDELRAWCRELLTRAGYRDVALGVDSAKAARRLRCGQGG